MLLQPRDEKYDDYCHSVICEGISTVYDFCGYQTTTSLLTSLGEVIVQCLNGPRPLACHIETFQRCLVSLAPKQSSHFLTTQEMARQRDMSNNIRHNASQYNGATPSVFKNQMVITNNHSMNNTTTTEKDKNYFQQCLISIITTSLESALKYLYSCGTFHFHSVFFCSQQSHNLFSFIFHRFYEFTS
jgi:hypothetical protein